MNFDKTVEDIGRKVLSFFHYNAKNWNFRGGADDTIRISSELWEEIPIETRKKITEYDMSVSAGEVGIVFLLVCVTIILIMI